MKNKPIKGKKTGQTKSREVREDEKIDLPKHKYPNPTEKDTQLKNQPEFIEPRGNKEEKDE